MSHFQTAVSDFMSTPLVKIASHQTLKDADQLMAARKLSALPVTSETGEVQGVISRTDLLRAGVLTPGKGLNLPDQTVESVMSRPALVIGANDPLSAAARSMLKNRVHRLFVTANGDPVGVLSTHDLMRAICGAGVSTPIGRIASRSLVKVRTSDPISLAVERLDVSNKQGLVVMYEKWPVGLFSQVDALESQSREPSDLVEEAMDHRILAFPDSMPLFRAVAQALSFGVTRIVVIGDGAEGIVSGLDFARVIAESSGSVVVNGNP